MLSPLRLLIALILTGGAAIGSLASAQEATPTPAASPAVTTPGPAQPGDPTVQLVKIADGLVDPIAVVNAGDGSGRLFVIERIGRVRIIADGILLNTPFLDITRQVATQFIEQGLLGLAFHPEYEINGRFFVSYTDFLSNGDSFVVEYAVSADDPNRADLSSRVRIRFDRPSVNHNGGTIRFGPDGYLYLASGDGGFAGYTWHSTAQDLTTLFGKLIRIDVDTPEEVAYAIPRDNPFVDDGLRLTPVADDPSLIGDNTRPPRSEVWAFGLRNPWLFSFDRATGDLYIPDVGQGEYEEINFQPGGSPGGQNYGWIWFEGGHCYWDHAPAECSLPFTFPVAEYEHIDGNCSISGIGVYRGQMFPAFDGIYFHSDFCSGRIWGLSQAGDGWDYRELYDSDLLVTGGGEDEAGELYLTSCDCELDAPYDPFANQTGAVWHIVPTELA